MGRLQIQRALSELQSAVTVLIEPSESGTHSEQFAANLIQFVFNTF